MTNKIPAPGEFYRHFKNKYYQIIAIAAHSETKEKMVVYQALYDDFGVYVRPLDMFISEVDHEKYPDVKQLFRFEKVTAEEVNIGVKKMKEATKDETKEATTSEASKEAKKTVLQRVISGEKPEELTKEEQLEKACPDGEEAPDPILMGFLDLRTMTEKSKFLSEHKKQLTDDIINAMAASLDITVEDGPIELRYSSLRSCLQTKAKYEINRLRG